jgi:hypothetical protein
VNTAYCDNLADVLCVNQVRIDFTDKPITAWGGMGVLMGKFLEKIQFRDWVERHVPIIETSPNAGGVYEKVLGQLLTVLGGGYRFAHSMMWNHGVEALTRVFGVDWLPLAPSTLTRFWNKIDSQALVEQLGNASRLLAKTFINWEGIREDNLNLDASVLTRYGMQQGAHRGYNPKKPGRPSHHPILAFLGSGYVVNVWNRSGDCHAGQGALDFFQQTVMTLGSSFRVKRVLCDTSFYQVNFIDHLQDNGYNYIIAVPIWPIFQKQIMRIQHWQPIDDGIEVAEFEFKHFDPKWKRWLRYVVVRQEIAARPQASGKQPSLFKELEELKNYRFSLLTCNERQLSPEQVWREYRPRANDENVVKDLKEGYGFAAFNLPNFWATEAVMIMNALVFHNLVHYLNRNVINPNAAVEQLKTLRIKYFIVPAQLGSEARYSVLRLGVQQGKIRTKITSLLRDIANIPYHLFNCNAVEYNLAVG